MADLLLGTLLVAGGYLLAFGLLATPFLLPFRKRICAWLDRVPLRRLRMGLAIMAAAFAFSLWSQFFAPPFGLYNGHVARFWMHRAAAAAPERREMLVHDIASGTRYGTHIAWSAIRDVAEVAMRCELWESVMTTPGAYPVGSLVTEYRVQCAHLPDPAPRAREK